MSKKSISQDVMCIKIMNNTQQLVEQYNLYYSDKKPDIKKYNNVSTVFLIGEVANGKIPLIGVCDVVISECVSINQAFEGYAKGDSGWKYEWKLYNLQKVNVPDIRECILEPVGDEDKRLITSLQKIVYIESSNLIIPKIGINLGNNTISVIETETEGGHGPSEIPQVKRDSLEKPYKMGDIVHLKNRIDKGFEKGLVTDIEDLIDIDILYDQKLTIQLENKECKKYSAVVLRRLDS